MTRALIASSGSWSLVDRTPRPNGDWVRVRVAVAGICRTDIQAMQGLREVAEGRVLGHEAAGTIEHIPDAVRSLAHSRGLAEGSRVAFFPFLPCGACTSCREDDGHFCAYSTWVGLDCDGAFADTVDLPVEVLYRAPEALSWKALAYAEPVAAASGVWGVDAVHHAKRIGVVGRGRIAQLTQRILHLNRDHVALLDPDEDITPDFFDVLVETWPTERSLARIARGLRPGGTLVVKSRPAQAVAWPHQQITLKRLHCIGAPYGNFRTALEVMATGELDVADMLGKSYPFTAQGIQQALHDETHGGERQGKLFFEIDPCAD